MPVVLARLAMIAAETAVAALVATLIERITHEDEA